MADLLAGSPSLDLPSSIDFFQDLCDADGFDFLLDNTAHDELCAPRRDSSDVPTPKSAKSAVTSLADAFNDAPPVPAGPTTATVHRKCSLGAGAGMAPAVLSDFELPDDTSWLHDDSPFAAHPASLPPPAASSSGMTASTLRASESATDLLVPAAQSAAATAPPADSASTVTAPRPAAQPAPPRAEAAPAGGHLVRIMPVWMMPSAEHPQGRVVMMPVHFMPPAGATAAAPAATQAANAPQRGGASAGRKRRASDDGRGRGAAKRPAPAPPIIFVPAPMATMPALAHAPARGAPHGLLPMRPVPAARRQGGGGTLPPFAAATAPPPPPPQRLAN